MHDPEVRSPLERFAIPYQFAPRLTLYGGLLALTSALAQILLGCLIGALWGIRIWLVALSLHSNLWKVFAILGLAAAMLASLALLLWTVRTLMGRLAKHYGPLITPGNAEE
jgi:hypothetical protein